MQSDVLLGQARQVQILLLPEDCPGMPRQVSEQAGQQRAAYRSDLVWSGGALVGEGNAQSDDSRDGAHVQHKGGKALVVWSSGTWSVFQEASQKD